MSTHTLTEGALLENGDLIDTTIGQLLGQGLGYDDWKMELENLGGFAWTESLKNVIIKKEFSFFKEEILRLQAEPNTTRGLKSKTNSLESILKRLQGLEWVKGVPNEMEARKRDGRLLGKDAKARCLQYHVSRWKSEAALAFQQLTTGTSNSKFVEVLTEPKESEAIPSKLTQAAPTITATSPLPNALMANFSNNDVLSFDNSYTFQTPSDVPSSDILSIFGHTAQPPASDPTLSGDREIPWVPHAHSYEVGTDGADITLEDFFRFDEQEPNFPVEPLSEASYFELPRRNGINDSCETYISQTRKDANTHGLILGEILNHYSTQSNKAIWSTSVTEDATYVDAKSQFDYRQICVRNTAFSEQNLGRLPQDPTHSNCRSDVESDLFFHIFDSESLVSENTFSLEPDREGDQETIVSILRDQDAAPSMAEITSRVSYDKDGNAQDDSLNYIEEELRKKRQELATAEITVSKLSTEVKLLEETFAKRRRHNSKEPYFEGTPRPKITHKRSNDGAPRRAKRLKGNAAAPKFEPENFKHPNAEIEVCCLHDRHITAMENTSPTTVDDAGGRSYHYFDQKPDVISSHNIVMPSLSNSIIPDPYLTQAVQDPGQCLLGLGVGEQPPISQRFDRSNVTQSLPMETSCSGFPSWDENTSRFRSNSGYTSLHSNLLNCRASSIDAMDGLDESIAWVA
ncbi:hypothetical protein N431DRAFT_386458 [Stipitochalara longipes BDJ]|nr:hypothetical protein N431DRAFT_386458 [Stipitochalara longipes BDJ]